VLFPSGPYLLHGQLAYPEQNRSEGALVLAGPHPLLGGNMQNNVVRYLADSLAERGLVTLRYDYRGVGRSEGPPVDAARHLAEFWQRSHIEGEMDFRQDLQAATGFMEKTLPGLPLAIVGYSFGCALLPYVGQNENLTALVLIAPTVAKHDYRPFREVQKALLVIASEDDFATDTEQLVEWMGTLAMSRQLVRKRCDNHFFRGHEEWLVETIFGFLNSHRK
jgi:alpha/beta superfamily hydrolase